jgi:hypothetical protein
MAEEKQMFGLVCKDQFDRIDKKLEETLRLLRGKNSEPGLVDDVRDLKKAYKRILGGGLFILAAFVVQIIRSLANWISGISQ